MANVYVRSAAGGAATGADWANAYLTLAAAYSAKAAGDDFWVAGDHAETQASAMTLTCPGTLASPCRTICASHTGTVPPVSADLLTTATITTTGSNSMSLGGCSYFYGITFNAGSGAGSSMQFSLGLTAHSYLYFRSCALNIKITTNASLFLLGTASNSIGTRIICDNTSFEFGVITSGLELRGAEFRWFGAASITGATFPTNLFTVGTTSAGVALLEGIDLSALTGKTLVQSMTKGGRFYFKDCKLPASVTKYAAPASSSAEVYFFRCSSSAVAYDIEKGTVLGAQTTETTIVRTGGKTINSTPVAMKLVGTASAKPLQPFASTPMVINNGATGASRTITVYGIWSGGAVPNNDEVWMEVSYLGSAATPRATVVSTYKADPLAAATANTSDTSTWGGSTTKFKLTSTFTPQLAGEISITVFTSSTNSTYIDPLPVLS